MWDDKYTEAILKCQVPRGIFSNQPRISFSCNFSAEDRFVDNPAHSVALCTVCVRVDNDGSLPTELAQAADMCKEDLPHPVMLCTEYNMWVMKWKQQHTDSTDITNKLVDTFNSCSELQFPNINTRSASSGFNFANSIL